LIKEIKSEQRHGTVAKFYQIRDRIFVLTFNPEFKRLNIQSPIKSKLLEPWVIDRKLNAIIVVGSPDPHGPWKARASDSCCAIDFALFLGTFTDGKNIPNYKLDVEVREKDLNENLILIGGPMVNLITQKVNPKLPIYIDLNGEKNIVSKISGKNYIEEESGLIAVIDNPWNSKKKILVLAGKRFQGTRSAVIAWIKYLDKIAKGNKFKPKIIARIVKGYDLDGDGIIDSAEILE
jgi:hypothetical protein